MNLSNGNEKIIDIDCPYCKKVHKGKISKDLILSGGENGLKNVLIMLPCGRKIVIFVSKDGCCRGYTTIDATNMIDFPAEKGVPSNYNDEYALFKKLKKINNI